MLQDIPTPTLREASPCVLETERLLLRKPTLADVKAIARLANDRRIADNTRRLPHPYSDRDAIGLLEQVFAKLVMGSVPRSALFHNYALLQMMDRFRECLPSLGVAQGERPAFRFCQ